MRTLSAVLIIESKLQNLAQPRGSRLVAWRKSLRAFAVILLSIFAVTLTSTTSATVAAEDGVHGFALLYLPVITQRRPLPFSASLLLPQIEQNSSWYCTWIMIVGKELGAQYPSFVQIGLIRRPEIDHTLRAFIAFQRMGATPKPVTSISQAFTHFDVPFKASLPLEYRELGKISEGPHEVAMIFRNGNVGFLVDGRVLSWSLDVSLADPYLQIGSEVSLVGDVITGRIANLTAEKASADYSRVSPCVSESSGLSLSIQEGVIIAVGTPRKRAACSFPWRLLVHFVTFKNLNARGAIKTGVYSRRSL